MHERVERTKFIHVQASEHLVTLDAAQSVLLEGADWHDLALSLNLVHHVAQPHLFSDSRCWHCSSVERVFSQTQLVGKAIAIYELTLAFAREHCLELLENPRELQLRSLKRTELPRNGLAPEK